MRYNLSVRIRRPCMGQGNVGFGAHVFCRDDGFGTGRKARHGRHRRDGYETERDTVVQATHAHAETVRNAVAPIVASLGLELFDVELTGAGKSRTLRITIDRAGGVDLDAITAVTQAISPVLDAEPIPGPYLLEVSSPGLERTLRRPEHFRGALDATVSIKFHTDEGPVRVRGTLVSASDDDCTVVADGTPRVIGYDAITAAHTVFEWGPQPKPDRARAGAKEKTR